MSLELTPISQTPEAPSAVTFNSSASGIPNEVFDALVTTWANLLMADFIQRHPEHQAAGKRTMSSIPLIADTTHSFRTH
jgi:hypothetical protein